MEPIFEYIDSKLRKKPWSNHLFNYGPPGSLDYSISQMESETFTEPTVSSPEAMGESSMLYGGLTSLLDNDYGLGYESTIFIQDPVDTPTFQGDITDTLTYSPYAQPTAETALAESYSPSPLVSSTSELISASEYAESENYSASGGFEYSDSGENGYSDGSSDSGGDSSGGDSSGSE
ncbi:MAG: hypothetical protein KAQ83_00630 [Nanoarchaeota archaeon]|nr:hypothetical protein [Nanoarchaeota archaeon]